MIGPFKKQSPLHVQQEGVEPEGHAGEEEGGTTRRNFLRLRALRPADIFGTNFLAQKSRLDSTLGQLESEATARSTAAATCAFLITRR